MPRSRPRPMRGRPSAGAENCEARLRTRLGNTRADQASRMGRAPKCPMSAYSASAPVTHRNTAPRTRKACAPPVMAYRVSRIDGREHRGVLRYSPEPEGCDSNKPECHDWTEGSPYAPGAQRLHGKQHDQDDNRRAAPSATWRHRSRAQSEPSQRRSRSRSPTICQRAPPQSVRSRTAEPLPRSRAQMPPLPSPSSASRVCRRHPNNCCGVNPCRRATAHTVSLLS